MLEMIPFYLIFPNVAGFCGASTYMLSTYILSETIDCVHIIFRAGYPENRIISSATRHISYISLASTGHLKDRRTFTVYV